MATPVSSPNTPRRPGHASLRRCRVSEAGRIYFLTFVVRDRRPLFCNTRVAKLMVDLLSDGELSGRNPIHAWVVMPDHVHLLMELSEGENLSTSVARIKSGAARRINAALGGRGSVWAAGYHDHALRTEESVEHAAEYILMNPVRSGIVMFPGEYPFAWTRWSQP